jgi:hypothetical protein
MRKLPFCLVAVVADYAFGSNPPYVLYVLID